MKFGICTGSIERHKLEYIKKIGYDYFETNFKKICSLSDSLFETALSVVKESGLPCYAANRMLPSSFKIAKRELNYDIIGEYLEKGFSRSAALGVKKVVFGSGGARSTPKGTSKGDNYSKVAEFLKFAADIAARYDITIVIEPLSPFECNLINTIEQSVALAETVGAANIMAHADFFHMMRSGDDIPDVYAAKGKIGHSHISNPRTRAFPKSRCDSYYGAYVEALALSGCESCSIEGIALFFNSAAKKSIALCKQVTGEIPQYS